MFSAYVALVSYMGFYSILVGALIFYVYRVICTHIFLRRTRRGNKYKKSGDYALAIREAEIVLAFFTKYPWIDRYRNVLLVTYTPRTIREGSLRFIAHCYNALDGVEMAKTYFERTVKDYPNSKLALYWLQQFQIERELIDIAQNQPLVTVEDIKHRQYFNIGLIIYWLTLFGLFMVDMIRINATY